MGKFIGDGSGLTNLPSSIPSGGVIMWSGSTSAIPDGWALCDGQNGTPNLQNRFVVGAGSSYVVGATGGSADAVAVSHSHSASAGSAGSHSHSGSTSTSGSHKHSVRMYAGSGAYGEPLQQGGANPTPTSTSAAGDHSHSFSTSTNGNHSHLITVNSAGESGKNKNLPPYYALAYIMKL